MKFEQLHNLLKQIAEAREKSERWVAYEKFGLESFNIIKERFGVNPELEKQYLSKLDILFSKYHDTKCTYPAEIEYVIPYWFGSKIPTLPWKSLPPEKLRKLRIVCQKCGRLLSVGFILNRRIVMIDIDWIKFNKSIATKIIDLINQFDLPACITYNDGFHIFIPFDKSLSLWGFLLKGIDIDGKEHLWLNKALTEIRNEFVKVEVFIDAITPYPLQSWIWLELYKDVEPNEVNSVTFKSMKIPEHAISINWFYYGQSYNFEDLEIFTQFFSTLVEKLGLEVKKFKKIEVVEASEELIKQAQESTKIGNFRVKGLEMNFKPPEDLELHEGFETLFEVDFQTFLTICKKLDEKELLPRCIKHFLLQEVDKNVINWYVNIVSWYLLQHLNLWKEKDVEYYLAPHVAKLHGFQNPKMYYYVYFSQAQKRNEQLIFVKPYTIPLLNEALNYLVNSGFCNSCKYFTFCSRTDLPASTRLIAVINSIALEVIRDLELVRYVKPCVFANLFTQGLPMPKPRSYRW